MDEPLHLLQLHAAVAEHLVRPRIHRHHAVEDAGLRIAVELNKNFALFHDNLND